MGTLNLLAGTAHGKIGQFQFQTHGLKCVVRTKQPQGLTNAQAEQINKPVLQKLSEHYHLWAKYMLENFDTDYKKPQALWNYYTEVNRPSFVDGVTARTGWYVNKKAGLSVPAGVYFPDPANDSGRLEFSETPPNEYLNYDVLLIFGLDKKPIAQCEKLYAPYGAVIEGLPYIETEEDITKILGFIVSRNHAELISGAFTITAGPASGLPFWNAPDEFINGGILVNYNTVTAAAIAAAITIDEAAVPAQFNGYKWRFIFNKKLGALLPGTTHTITRGQSLDVSANCEAWAADEIIATVELYDPAETTICSPPINLLSALVPQTPAAFGVGSPSAFSWTANLAGSVTLSYIPVLAGVPSPLADYRETATLTHVFGSLPLGEKIENLYQTTYTQASITGTPPIQDQCALSEIYDTRTNALVSQTQRIDAERAQINATAQQLAALISIYQTSLLWRNITTTAKLAAERIPAQYSDCVFSLTFTRAVGGIAAGGAVSVSTAADTALASGAAFPPQGVTVAAARLYSEALQKNYSTVFNVAYNYEILGGAGQSPFTVTITTEDEGGGDILCTLSINTAAYKNISYYNGFVEVNFTRYIYDYSTMAFEGLDEDDPIADGKAAYIQGDEGSPYTGQNGTCYFTRENEIGEWETIAQNVRVYTAVA